MPHALRDGGNIDAVEDSLRPPHVPKEIGTNVALQAQLLPKPRHLETNGIHGPWLPFAVEKDMFGAASLSAEFIHQPLHRTVEVNNARLAGLLLRLVLTEE